MRTYVFIDASNLFYGGRKSLGWDIDYKKLAQYLKTRYGANKIYYFGGVEIHKFSFNYIEYNTVPIRGVAEYLIDYLDKNKNNLDPNKMILINKDINRIRFYIKLEEFGFNLVLKPVNTHIDKNGVFQKKANCDVDMTLFSLRYINSFDRALFLSGDGDFLPILKYLRENKKEVLVLARSKRTAREIKQFAGDKFLDFEFLRIYIEYKRNNLYS
jgi:uncharacterized LabA/DUF88 family protein